MTDMSNAERRALHEALQGIEADAAFIAALNPTTVLAMATTIRAERERAEKAEAERDEAQRLACEYAMRAGNFYEALRGLTMTARTSGGTAGPDAGLMLACETAERALSSGLHPDAGGSLPTPAGETITSRELVERCGGVWGAPVQTHPFPPEMREPSLTTAPEPAGEVGDLVAALEPFAEYADDKAEFCDGDGTPLPDHVQTWPTFTLGDFRRLSTALAAYKRKGGEHG